MSNYDENVSREISPQLAFAQHLASQSKSEYGCRDGSIYQWESTHWELVAVTAAERMAHSWLAKNVPNKCSEKTAASCVATAILHLAELPPIREAVIPLQSGSIEVTAGGVAHRESKTDDGLTYVLSCGYDLLAECPTFDEFLREALPDEEVRNFLQEFAGYTLLPDTRYQLAAWLVGGGGNGKSTFAQVMQALHRRPVSMSLDALDGFNLVGLIGASLVYCDETPNRIDEQRLKTLVSGDSVKIDRKYRDPLTIRPTAKWIVSGNALPTISDHSDGFWRRWVVVPFVTKPQTVRPLLAESIIRTELAGVLNWSIQGLQRLLSRDKFPPLPVRMVAAACRGKEASNSVAAWIADVGIVTDKVVINTRRSIYANYTAWCPEAGMKAISTQKFWERIRLLLPDLIENHGRSNGERTWLVNIPLPHKT